MVDPALTICRICLVGNVRLSKILDKKLLEIYEKLSSVPFDSGDGRPSHVCYMCYERLRKCYQFSVKCVETEGMFTRMIEQYNQIIEHKFHMKPFGALTMATQVDTYDSHYIQEDVIKREPLDERDDNFKTLDMNQQAQDEHFKSSEVDYDAMKLKEAKETVGKELQVEFSPLIVANIKQEPESDDEGSTRKQEYNTTVQDAGNKRVQTNTEDKSNLHEDKVNIKDNTLPPVALDGKVKTIRKTYKCDVCQKLFRKHKYLKIHSRIHTGEKPFKCQTCESSFSQKSVLNRHIRTHTGDKPYTCDICQSSFSRKGSLVVHVRTHTGDKPYYCNICQLSFSQKYHLTTHVRIHTGDSPYKCEMCPSSFRAKVSLSRHVLSHTGDKPYKCDICQSSFNQKERLTSHARIHCFDKPYKCYICQLSFHRNSNLTRHIRTHTGDKPYMCNICQSSFSRKDHLSQHVCIQTDETSNKCDINLT